MSIYIDSPIERKSVSVSPTKKWVRNSELKPNHQPSTKFGADFPPKPEIKSNPIQSEV